MNGKLQKLAEKKELLKAQLAEISKQESMAMSAEKQLRKKEDDRIKLLLGVAILGEVPKNPAALNMVKMAVGNLTARDQEALLKSSLWSELTKNKPGV